MSNRTRGRAPHVCQVPVTRPEQGSLWECPQCFSHWLWETRPPHGAGYVKLRDTIETWRRRDEAEMARAQRRVIAWAVLALLVFLWVAAAVIGWALG